MKMNRNFETQEDIRVKVYINNGLEQDIWSVYIHSPNCSGAGESMKLSDAIQAAVKRWFSIRENQLSGKQ